jgi:hypothetical protein
VKLWDLERAVEILSIPDPQIPPAGPMVQYAGEQLTLEEITTAYEGRAGERQDWTPALMNVLRSIRSFPVMSLQGARVTCSPDHFDLQMPALFTQHLPDISWDSRSSINKGAYGLVEKYHLLDGAYVAPADAATHQAMVIELCGQVSGLDGSLEHRQPFPDTVVVTITHAHWSNVSGLGIGAGFYM